MSPGDIVLITVPQVTGGAKLRPAVILALLPGAYQSLLLCGISTQTQAVQPDWDEPIGPGDPDFKASGLHQASIIRLSFVRAAGTAEVARQIGRIDDARLGRLRQRFSDHLRPLQSPGTNP